MKAAKMEPMVTRSTRSTNPKLEEPPQTQTKPTNRQPSPSRSTANRQSSPSRSAKNRQTSPSRSSRKKSPARRSPSRRSPARKSPARKSSPSPSRKPTPKKSPTRVSPKIEKHTEIETKRSLRVNLTKTLNDRKDDIFLRSSIKNTNGVDADRIRNLREQQTFQTNSAPELIHRRVTERDSSIEGTARSSERSVDRSEWDDLSEEEITMPFLETRKLITPSIDSRRFVLSRSSKIFAALNIVGMPLVYISLNIICSQQPCTFTEWPDLKMYNRLESWINLRSVILVFVFFLINALLSLVPYFGKKTALPDGKRSFVANSLFNLFLIMPALFAINMFCLPIFTIIYEDYVQLTTSSIVLSLSLALAMYVKGGRVPKRLRNPNGNSGNFFYDLWMGREINPVLFNVFHIKVLLFRHALYGMILVNLAWIIDSLNTENIPALTFDSLSNATTYEKIWGSVTLQPTVLLFTILQIVYSFDALLNESSQMMTLEFMHEGVGCLICNVYFLYPFMPTLITKRLLEQNIFFSYWVLILASVVFLIGFYIYRESNNQKNIFRQNPFDPRVQHFETIPTFHGKHLLVGGWWGFVQHPNYLGDMILHTSWAIATYNAIPIFLILFTYIVLIHRTKRDATRCSEKYGVSWKRYCQKVPYSLVPRIY